MRHNYSVLTNTPAEIDFPDYDNLGQRLAPEAAVKLAEINGALHDIGTTQQNSDEQIVQTVRDYAGNYVNFFSESSERALDYLGYDADVAEIEGTQAENSANNNRARRFHGLAFAKIATAFDQECAALGIADDAKTECESVFYEWYATFADELGQDVAAGNARFGMLIENFGAPDVLRVEAAAAGIISVEGLAKRLQGYGKRPAKQTIHGRMAEAFRGRPDAFSRKRYDEVVAEKLDRFSMPDTTNLLESYTKSAILYYAKRCFGETYVIFDQGLSNNFVALYDYLGAKKGSVRKRPVLPLERVRGTTDEALTKLLYSDESPLADQFRHFGTAEQRKARRERRYIYDHYRHTSATSDRFRATPKAPPQSPRNKTDPWEGVDRRSQSLYLEFSRLISNTKLSSKFKLDRKQYETDSICRIRTISYEGPEEEVTLRRFLLRTMKALHPDINPGDEATADLFGYYSLIWGSLKEDEQT